MLLPIIDVGFKNYIFSKEIVMLINPDSKPAQRIKLKARDNNQILDLTAGRAASCLILLNNGEVAISSFETGTIKRRYSNYANKVNELNSKVSLEPFIEIGFENYVLPYNLTGIYSAKPTPMVNIVKNAKARDMLIDCTKGKKTRSVLILDQGYVVISNKSSKAIKNNYMSYVNNINHIEDYQIEKDEDDDDDDEDNELELKEEELHDK